MNFEEEDDEEMCDCKCGRKQAPPLFAHLKNLHGWNPHPSEEVEYIPDTPRAGKRLPDGGPTTLEDFVEVSA